jgi:hypothetical protein
MAFDEKAAQRLRDALADQPAVTEKRMMGGLIFMVHGHIHIANRANCARTS